MAGDLDFYTNNYDWSQGASDWGSGTDYNYGSNWDLGSLSDYGGVGNNTDWGSSQNYPSEWVNNTPQGSDWEGINTEAGTTGGSAYDPGIMNTLWDGLSTAGNWLQSAYNTPLGKQLAGLGLNYLANQYGQNKTGSAPNFQPMGTATQNYNDPYVQAMLGQTRNQVEAAARARGTYGNGATLQQIADATYSKNLLPLMQLQSGQNQAMNAQNMQGYSIKNQNNNSLYGGLGTGLNNILNNSANMDMLDQMVSKILGPAQSQEEKTGRDDALNGLAPQSNDPKYLKGYYAAKQVTQNTGA